MPLGPEGLDALDDYEPRTLTRVWRAQNFSYWMTQMLHTPPGASAFDVRRQMGELDNVVPRAPAGPTLPSSTPGGRAGPELRSWAPARDL